MKVAVLSLLVSTVVLNLLPLMREDVLYLIVGSSTVLGALVSKVGRFTFTLSD